MEEMKIDDRCVAYLFEKKLINNMQREDLLVEPSRYKKVVYLLKHLELKVKEEQDSPEETSETYSLFKEVLRKTGQEDLFLRNHPDMIATLGNQELQQFGTAASEPQSPAARCQNEAAMSLAEGQMVNQEHLSENTCKITNQKGKRDQTCPKSIILEDNSQQCPERLPTSGMYCI